MFRTARRRVLAAASSAALVAVAALGSPVAADDVAPLPTVDPIVESDTSPPQPGEQGKVAEPADDVMHPGSETEWWYVGIMDPSSKRTFIAVITSAPTPTVAAVMLYPNGKDPLVPSLDTPLPYSSVPTKAPANDGLPGVRTPQGRLDFDETRQAYHLVLSAPYKANIWFDGNPLPGITGQTYLTDRGMEGEWMGWSSPVASSTVHGWVQGPLGRQVSVNGWRGYHDHNWGNFNMYDQQFDGWEWGVVFEPDGGSSIIAGIVRPGGVWRGTVVDVRPTGTRACISTLELGDWHKGTTPMDGSTFALPGTITARSVPDLCATSERHEFEKTFYLEDPVVADGVIMAASLEARYHSGPGTFGLYEHIRSLRARLENAGYDAPIEHNDLTRVTSPVTALLRTLLGGAA